MPKFTTAALTACAAAAITLLGAAPAQAATNPYTPAQICGSGYKTVSGGYFGLTGADMYVMYNSAAGRNCVAVVKRSNIGTATSVGAGFKLSSDPTWRAGVNYELGNFKYYAVSPTKYYAKGKCIDIYGVSGSSKVQQFKVFCG
ncbi:spore-associated protein [Kineococcus glutinatus]|uniref:Spore-associated protein A n=1 Tax=Kineococcus glutinatus TaxID=1070872 RepID=A0ABP9HRQ4_9ACTN